MTTKYLATRTNSNSKDLELWLCYAEGQGADGPANRFVRKVGVEHPVHGSRRHRAAVWSNDQTLGNASPLLPLLDATPHPRTTYKTTFPCEFVRAGKFRHGADRWWCRSHQAYWGTKGDFDALETTQAMCCSRSHSEVFYLAEPLLLNPNDYAEIGVWCSLPPALSSLPILPRPPRIHLHVRRESTGIKVLDRDFDSVSVTYNNPKDLFGAEEPAEICITPPAALAFMRGVEDGSDLGLIHCVRCGWPHCDQGSFGEQGHKKHFCGNCGFDSTWSRTSLISTQVKPLFDLYARNTDIQEAEGKLILDDFLDCTYFVWASTPALLWTADRPQQRGIHVHVVKDGRFLVDETYGEVILDGVKLDRAELIRTMIAAAKDTCVASDRRGAEHSKSPCLMCADSKPMLDRSISGPTNPLT